MGELSTLWKHFDKNNDGVIDVTEFKELVYRSLLLFCKKRNPDLPPPGKGNMEPFINKLVKELQPWVDKDKDMKITEKEFSNFGNYLTRESNKLQVELQNNGGTNMAEMKPGTYE